MPTRRTFLIWAAVGAASVAGLWRRLGLRRLLAEGAEPTKLGLLREVGDIWLFIGAHAKGEAADPEAYALLGERMEAALGRLEELASRGLIRKDNAAALALAVRERYQHVERSAYAMATCYRMTAVGTDVMQSRGRIEEQVRLLTRLHAEGKLTPKATAKGQAAIARELAFLITRHGLDGTGGTGGEIVPPRWEELAAVDKLYREGGIRATETTLRVADILVAFSLALPEGEPPRPEPPPEPVCYMVFVEF